MPSVTGLVFDASGRILLLRHSNGGVWVAPGGSLEPNELPADAVVREVWEETGLEVEPVRIAGVYGGPAFEVQYQNGDRVSYVMTVFECRVIGGSLQADGIETLEAAYYSEEQARQLPLAAWAEVVLPEAFARRDETTFQQPSWRPPVQS